MQENQFASSIAENTVTNLTVRIITPSSSGTILKIRNSIGGLAEETFYTHLKGSHAYGEKDIAQLVRFHSTLQRMLHATPSRKELVRRLGNIIEAENQSIALCRAIRGSANLGS